jgi:hypothetical protein
MEREHIKTVVSNLFAGADERNWEKVEETLSGLVLLDYTSMNGGAPAELTPKQITGAWAAFMPGFDRTHHQLSDFEIKENDKTASAHYYGKADHFMGKEIWTVEGSYDTVLENVNGTWKITKHILNFDRQLGNTELPAMAVEKLKKKSS